MLNQEFMNELENIRKQLKIDKMNLLFKGYKAAFNFAILETIRRFGDAIENGQIARYGK